MEVYLVQHGEAAPESENPQRPLTARGARDVRLVAAFLSAVGVRPGRILHSGKLRAAQTAEIMAEELRPRGGVGEMGGLSPMDPPDQAREAIERSDAPIMLCGHLPHLSRLASLLVLGRVDAEFIRFRMGGAVCLARDDAGWRHAWSVTPDLLARGGVRIDALRCIYTKRETRVFVREEVPDGVIEKILEAGRLSGSAKNRQPWDFILIRDRETLRRLARYGYYASHLPEASFAIVIVIEGGYVHDPFDAGRAAQNMMLAAHALGVGSCPITLHREEGAKTLLGVPRDKKIQVCIAFGPPEKTPTGKRAARKPLEEILHREKW